MSKLYGDKSCVTVDVLKPMFIWFLVKNGFTENAVLHCHDAKSVYPNIDFLGMGCRKGFRT
jgi:hypothetical protein